MATSVLVVAITALAASGGHVFQFAQGAETSLLRMANVLIFTVPGVVVGAQLGPLLADRVSDRRMEIALGVLFTGTAALLLAESTLL